MKFFPVIESSTARIYWSVSVVCFCLISSVHSFAPSSFSSISTSAKLPFQTKHQTRHHDIQQVGHLLKIRRTGNPIEIIGTGSPTALHAVGGGAIALRTITGALFGGIFAGGLHAISGPDHLAALLPRCCGQRWYKAGRVGALWGIGHGVSATIIGVLAYGLKSTLATGSRTKAVLASVSHLTEVAVGLSLILIGVMGIKEAREWEDEIIEMDAAMSLSAAAADTGLKLQQKRAVIFNGLLHGFSWDGAPSLAPAVAVASWAGNLSFLTAYAFGTMATMAIATTLIGEGTRKAGEFFSRPDIPQKLSYFSSILAIAIGGVWCGLAFA